LLDCTPELLARFSRYQEVKRCWRKEDAKWVLKDISYVGQWDEKKKQSVIVSLFSCIQNGGRVVGAFIGDTLVGFASIDAKLFGSQNQYVDLAMIHTSDGYRNKGIGRQLFNVACEHAKELNAKKLYISAHSAEDSMAFYRKIGCVDAIEINQELAEKEPCDCQLEYTL
jgi:ribosomal protein S18 acetylase RimI-like enzyme